MSDFENPYKSPETSIVPEKDQSTGTVLTETMLTYLKEASPWLRFVGIVEFIGCGLMCLGGISFSITTSALPGMTEAVGNFPVWILSLVYIIGGALVFFPAKFTYSFGVKIRNYQISSSAEDLELAFKNNKSLWKFQGIMLIISFAVVPVFFVIAIVGIVAAGI